MVLSLPDHLTQFFPVVSNLHLLSPKNPILCLRGEGQADWMMWMNFVKELLMAAEMSKAGALEPCTLVKAKCHPDWPLWEKAINEELYRNTSSSRDLETH